MLQAMKDDLEKFVFRERREEIRRCLRSIKETSVGQAIVMGWFNGCNTIMVESMRQKIKRIPKNVKKDKDGTLGNTKKKDGKKIIGGKC